MRAPGAAPHLVEFIGTGFQWVADGKHPSGRDYGWPRAPGKYEDWTETGLAERDRTKEAICVLLDLLGAEITHVGAGSGAGRDGVDQSTLVAPSAKLLAEAVGQMPNNGGYEDWIRGLCAVKAAARGLLDDDGRELARDWTERWSGEGAGGGPSIDFDTKWDQLKPPFSTGWRTIEREAREGTGWFGGVAADFEGVDLGTVGTGHNGGPPLEDDPNATLQERMFKRYVWIEDLERVGDTVDKDLLTRNQFNARMAEIGPIYDTRRSAWAQFFEPKHGEVRCKRVKRCTYRPGQPAIVPEHGVECFNTWRPSALVPAKGVTDEDVAPWLTLGRRLFGIDDVREKVISWLGGLVQRPGVKPAFVLVMGGHEGIGKDSFVAPLVRALGLHNVSSVTMATVMGPNTHWVAQKQLVIITETHSFSRREVMEKLKPIGACPPDELEVNIKYTPQFWVPNIIAGIYFTNHVDALALSDSDRRHFVAWSEHENPETMTPAEKDAFEAWFTKVYYPWLDNGGAEKVIGWLLQRDLTAFLKLARAPMTEGKAMMRREGRSEAVAALEDALESMDLPDLVNPEDLAARLNTGGRSGKLVTGHAVARALRGMGAKMLTGDAVKVPPSALRIDAKRVRIWALRNETVYLAQRPAALARIFSEMWGATKQDVQGFFSPHLAVDNSSVEPGSVEVGSLRDSLL